MSAYKNQFHTTGPERRPNSLSEAQRVGHALERYVSPAMRTGVGCDTLMAMKKARRERFISLEELDLNILRKNAAQKLDRTSIAVRTDLLRKNDSRTPAAIDVRGGSSNGNWTTAPASRAGALSDNSGYVSANWPTQRPNAPVLGPKANAAVTSRTPLPEDEDATIKALRQDMHPSKGKRMLSR